MKRTLLAAIVVGVVTLVAASRGLLRAERAEPAVPRDDGTKSSQEDVRLPAAFRQCQPKHWRYVMLSQNR